MLENVLPVIFLVYQGQIESKSEAYDVDRSSIKTAGQIFLRGNSVQKFWPLN